MYYAAKMSWKMGYPGGYGEKVGEYVGTQLSPSPDYALLAKACHAYGERVENPLDLIPAIEKAVQVVRGGQPAVLDVRIQRP
jgi:acetolactate synthase-1/2/3 large subunit